MCREKVYSCMKEVEYKQFCREGEFLRTVFCLFFMQLSCPGRSCCVSLCMAFVAFAPWLAFAAFVAFVTFCFLDLVAFVFTPSWLC